MRARFRLYRLEAPLLALVLLLGCARVESESVPPATENHLRVATWNIRFFPSPRRHEHVLAESGGHGGQFVGYIFDRNAVSISDVETVTRLQMTPDLRPGLFARVTSRTTCRTTTSTCRITAPK